MLFCAAVGTSEYFVSLSYIKFARFRLRLFRGSAGSF
jgi:hypothetical protein